MVGKAKKSTHGKKAGAKALAKRRSAKAPAPKKRVEIGENVSNQNKIYNLTVKYWDFVPTYTKNFLETLRRGRNWPRLFGMGQEKNQKCQGENCQGVLPEERRKASHLGKMDRPIPRCFGG